MKIAIISDIHDKEGKLLKALRGAAQEGGEILLCLGDFGSSRSLQLLRENWDGPIHFVLGNCDWPPHQYKEMAQPWPQTTCHGDSGEIELDGRKIYITHYPEMAQRAAQLDYHDAIFYGHSHRAEQHREQDSLVANPGEIQGRTGSSSWALYDSCTHSLKHYALP